MGVGTRTAAGALRDTWIALVEGAEAGAGVGVGVALTCDWECVKAPSTAGVTYCAPPGVGNAVKRLDRQPPWECQRHTSSRHCSHGRAKAHSALGKGGLGANGV